MAYQALYLMLEEELDKRWTLAQQEQARARKRQAVAFAAAMAAACVFPMLAYWQYTMLLAVARWTVMLARLLT